MKQARRLSTLLALLALLTCCKADPLPATPPSPGPLVLLISVDALRADRLNCYGYRERQVSPHIDALASEGILFENHITSSPWTTPAHMSLLTSLAPSAHGVIASFEELGEDGAFTRLAEARTTLAEVLAGQGMATAAFTAGGTVDPELGFGQGFQRYDSTMIKLGEKNMASLFGWLRAHREQRKFLFWHHFEVHAPYLRPDFLDSALPAGSAAGLRAELARLSAGIAGLDPLGQAMPRFHGEMLQVLRKHGAYRKQVCEALYLGGVRSADRWLGRLVRVLRDEGLYDRALIVLTSDHGEEFAERSDEAFYDRHGHTLHEELVRVPLVIRLPGGHAAGKRVSGVTRAVDVMPTILDQLGLVPARHEMQGATLRPLWEAKGGAASRVAYSEALAFGEERKGLRTERYKLVLAIAAGTVKQIGRGVLPEGPLPAELYDLRVDAGEIRNLLAGSAGPETLKLAGELELRLRQHQRGLAGRAEPVRLDAQTVEQLKSLGYVE